jgi:hypothetical protein
MYYGQQKQPESKITDFFKKLVAPHRPAKRLGSEVPAPIGDVRYEYQNGVLVEVPLIEPRQKQKRVDDEREPLTIDEENQAGATSAYDIPLDELERIAIEESLLSFTAESVKESEEYTHASEPITEKDEPPPKIPRVEPSPESRVPAIDSEKGVWEKWDLVPSDAWKIVFTYASTFSMGIILDAIGFVRCQRLGLFYKCLELWYNDPIYRDLNILTVNPTYLKNYEISPDFPALFLGKLKKLMRDCSCLSKAFAKEGSFPLDMNWGAWINWKFFISMRGSGNNRLVLRNLKPNSDIRINTVPIWSSNTILEYLPAFHQYIEAALGFFDVLTSLSKEWGHGDLILQQKVKTDDPTHQKLAIYAVAPDFIYGWTSLHKFEWSKAPPKISDILIDDLKK